MKLIPEYDPRVSKAIWEAAVREALEAALASGFDGAACLDATPDSEAAEEVRRSMSRHPSQGNKSRIRLVGD